MAETPMSGEGYPATLEGLWEAQGRIAQLEAVVEDWADHDTEVVLRNMLGKQIAHDCSTPTIHTCPGCWFDGLFEEARAALEQKEIT